MAKAKTNNLTVAGGHSYACTMILYVCCVIYTFVNPCVDWMTDNDVDPEVFASGIKWFIIRKIGAKIKLCYCLTGGRIVSDSVSLTRVQDFCFRAMSLWREKGKYFHENTNPFHEKYHNFISRKLIF